MKQLLNIWLLIASPILLASFQSEEEKSITVIGVGDIMLGTNFPSSSYLPANGGADIFPDDIVSVLKEGDLTFGNLEGTFLNEGGTVKRCSDPSKCYAFRMPTAYCQHLVTAGFDVMSIANNHLGDFGNTGRISTRKTLEANNIQSAGLLAHPKAIFEKDGVKYGFAAFAPNSGTCDIRNIEKATGITRELAELADVVIISFHGGAEGSKHEHVTHNTEYFYGENRGNVEAFSKAVIDAGADVVFGHGPHVTRAIEVYKDRFIIYSMGNFATYGRFNLSGPNGIAPIVKLSLAPDGKFQKAQIISIKQIDRGMPRLDETDAAFKKIKSLTDTDFPSHTLKFEDGFITQG